MKTRYLGFALFALVWFAIGLSSTSAKDPAFTPSVVENPEIRLLDQEGAGKLYQIGELLVCVMEGTPEEMGFQQGRLLASRVSNAAVKTMLDKAIWSKGYTPEYVKTQCERMEKHIPEPYLREMRAIVEGLKAGGVTDISYEDLRLMVTQGELLHYPPGEAPQCTNFAVWGQWTPDGRLLHGRNLDWTISEGGQDLSLIQIRRPKGGVPFVMVSWMGSVGGVTGMNAEGITIGEMTCMSSSATFDGMPLFMLMRHALETSSDLAAAVGVIEKGPRTLGWNFVIGDGKVPDARALDTDATTCDVYSAMDEKEKVADLHSPLPDAVRRTNHPMRMERLLKLVIAVGPRMNLPIQTMDQLRMILPLVKQQNTYTRYVWLGKQIEAHPKGIDVNVALQMLGNGPVFQDDTHHSCVFDPKDQTVYVAVAGNNPPLTATRRPYTCLPLGQWFGKSASN
jgi:hypothetical protein